MSEVRTSRRRALRDLVWYWLPPLAWMGVIFFLSAQPDLPGPPQPFIDAPLKKGAHLVAYALLALLCWRALSQGKEVDGRTLALAFAIAVAYGISDEFHQSFVPGREPSLRDVFIDAAGAAAALGVVWWRNPKGMQPTKSQRRH